MNSFNCSAFSSDEHGNKIFFRKIALKFRNRQNVSAFFFNVCRFERIVGNNCGYFCELTHVIFSIGRFVIAGQKTFFLQKKKRQDEKNR